MNTFATALALPTSSCPFSNFVSSGPTALTPAGYPIALSYYLSDSLSIAGTITPFTSCTASCTYSTSLGTQASSDLILAYNSALYSSIFSTSTASKAGAVVTLYMNGTISATNYYYFALATISILNPVITTVAIPDITYSLGDVTATITFTPFTNSLGITGDPKLAIVYNLYTSTGAFFSPGVVSAFNSATATITVGSAVTTYPRVNPMKVIAYFAYLPSNTVEVDFTIYYEICFSTAITPSTQAQINYQTGSASLTTALTAWTNTYGSACGSFTYSASISPPSTIITFTAATPSVTVSTSNSALVGTYIVTVTGTLTQPTTNAVYKSNSMTFNVIITAPDPCNSAIITTYTLSPISY